MTETKIREKLAAFCKTGDLKKIKAIYTMVEDDINEVETIIDEAFIKELDRRSKTFLDGTVKTYTINEAKKIARARVSNK